MMVNQFKIAKNMLSVLGLYHVGIASVFLTDVIRPIKVNVSAYLTHMRQSINQFLMQATGTGAVL